LVCVRSKSRPTPAGAQRFFRAPISELPAEPCTISTQIRRIFRSAARSPRPAGAIASRNGSAIVAPTPLRTARRDRCVRVRNKAIPRDPALRQAQGIPSVSRDERVALLPFFQALCRPRHAAVSVPGHLELAFHRAVVEELAAD